MKQQQQKKQNNIQTTVWFSASRNKPLLFLTIKSKTVTSKNTETKKSSYESSNIKSLSHTWQ